MTGDLDPKCGWKARAEDLSTSLVTVAQERDDAKTEAARLQPMTDTEAVLRDLLLECGVEGVTLWHIRALAAYNHGIRVAEATMRRPNPFILRSRLDSDLRGEDAVLAEALEFDTERAARRRAQRLGVTRNTSLRGRAVDRSVVDEACDHHPNTDCVRCR